MLRTWFVLGLGCCLTGAGLQARAAGYCQIVGRRESRTGLVAEGVSTIGMKRLLFFRARFPDDKQDPISMEEAGQTLTEVNATFERLSYGKFGLTWTVSAVLQLTKTREEYTGPGGFTRFIDDVRELGLAAGFDYRQYDLDMVRHSGVPDFPAGSANLGDRGAQVQAAGASVIVHELGHNLGLGHANLWVTGSPGLSFGSPPMPSNYQSIPDPKYIPVYPDSALGHESVTGPGHSAEYGDASDIMGSGTVEYSAIFRRQLGWLEDAQIADICDSVRTVRLQALEGKNTPELPRAIRAGAPFHSPAGERQYWIQLPPAETNGLPTPGVELRWGLSGGPGDSLLLAASGSSPEGGSVLLPPGRTFSDRLAHVHITVVDAGGTGDTRWAGVTVCHGTNSLNHEPTVSLAASALTAAAGEPVAFSATATDPDGDALVWRWDFGDGSTSTAAGAQSKAWRQAGDFVVSLEVSDMKGGVARRHVAVGVGGASTRRISGRVLTTTGEPLAGVRIHNGVFDPTGSSGRRYVSMLTDSSGRFTLAGLESGTYTNGAYLFGFSIARRAPTTVGDTDVDGVDFTATAWPRVSVTAASSVPESIGITNLFTFTRTGPTNEPLTVWFQLAGTAAGGSDYVRPLLNSIVIPAGSPSAALLLDVMDDAEAEPEESVVVHVLYPASAPRRDPQGEPFTVYYPGFELAQIDGQLTWLLTEPAYIPGDDPSATVVIQDDDAIPQTLTASLLENGRLQLKLTGQPGTALVLETRSGFKVWTPIQTNLLQKTGIVISILPVGTGSNAFYRTVAY